MRRFRPMPKGRRAPEFEEISPAGAGHEPEIAVRPTPPAWVRAGTGNPAPPARGAATGAHLPPACWRVARVARHLDLTKKRVYQLVEDGQLEAVRMGPRGMRILVPSIHRYMEGLRRMEERFRD